MHVLRGSGPSVLHRIGLVALLAGSSACVAGQAGSASERNVSLMGTYWKLTFVGEPITTAPEMPMPHLQLSAAGEASGSGGCNRFFGSFELDDDQLAFAALGSTRMACAQGMDQEQRFLAALGEVRSFVIRGDRLELRGAKGARLLEFEAAEGP